jgi:glycosyltransferase involved in cell wall biosynthesis
VNDQTLTILMPVYNAGAFVADAIRSVRAQTHQKFSLFIHNDGSTDDTLEICREFEKQDPRIRVFTHENIGIANTMNAALEDINGGWVFCMHGDDMMVPNRLERQLVFIEQNPDLAVVSSLVRLIDETGREIGRTKSSLVNRKTVSRMIGRGMCVAFNHPATAFRVEVVKSVGGYRQEFWPAEDTDLWSRVAQEHPVLVQDEYLLKYRIHGRSASNSKSRLMVRKLAWVARCVSSQRSHQAEPSWEEFLSERQHAPWPVRWNNQRKETARTLYQAAVQCFACRQYGVLISALAGAMVLEPSLVLPRILPRLLTR